MGINTRKFYYWRKRLREQDAASSGSQITPSGSLESASSRVRSTRAAAFVPVSIIDRSTTTELEIELANGCAVRLKGSVDLGLLQAAIMAAGEFDGSGRGDH